jgi:hypothetical protein
MKPEAAKLTREEFDVVAEKKLITTAEACRRLGVTHPTLTSYVRKGLHGVQLKPHTLAGRAWFTEEQLRAFISLTNERAPRPIWHTL